MNNTGIIIALSQKFIAECRNGNRSKAVKILDKIQKQMKTTDDIYLCTCKARIDIKSFKMEYAIDNIDKLMAELKNIIY